MVQSGVPGGLVIGLILGTVGGACSKGQQLASKIPPDEQALQGAPFCRHIKHKVCGVRQGSRPGTRERGWFLLEVIEILKVKVNLGV